MINAPPDRTGVVPLSAQTGGRRTVEKGRGCNPRPNRRCRTKGLPEGRHSRLPVDLAGVSGSSLRSQPDLRANMKQEEIIVGTALVAVLFTETRLRELGQGQALSLHFFNLIHLKTNTPIFKASVTRIPPLGFTRGGEPVEPPKAE
jgi:hypothetical protein